MSDVVTINTPSLRPKVVIVSAYFPPKISIQYFNGELERLCIFLDGFNNIILVGNFNTLILMIRFPAAGKMPSSTLSVLLPLVVLINSLQPSYTLMVVRVLVIL